MRFLACFSFVVVLASTAGCELAMAQTGDTAGIYGNIHDPSGSSVADASVVARNQDTGVERRTVTTESGDYVFANLPVGTYEVTASKPGFKVFSQQGIMLQVDRRAR